jgi:hypothetical protein
MTDGEVLSNDNYYLKVEKSDSNNNLSNSSSLSDFNFDFDHEKKILKTPFNNIELTKDNIKIS